MVREGLTIVSAPAEAALGFGSSLAVFLLSSCVGGGDQ